MGRRPWRNKRSGGYRNISCLYLPNIYQSFVFAPCLLGSELIKIRSVFIEFSLLEMLRLHFGGVFFFPSFKMVQKNVAINVVHL